MLGKIADKITNWLDGLNPVPRKRILWTVGAMLGLLLVFITYISANYIMILYEKVMHSLGL